MELTENFSEKAKHDYEIVKQAMEGNQQAYTQLLADYHEPVFYMMLKMVKNRRDAEDLTLEAFGKAFRNLQNYAPRYAFSTWLFKVATNNAIDFLRRQKAEKKLVTMSSTTDERVAESASLMHSTSPDPEANLISQQKEMLMQDIVNNLNPLYRELIEMRFFQEMSYTEIADKLNLPLGTVKARIHRAREMMLTAIKEQQDKNEDI